MHSVKGSDITGMWLTDTQYAFNIITQEDPDPAYNDAVLFNIGPVTYEVKNNSIVVDFLLRQLMNSWLKLRSGMR